MPGLYNNWEEAKLQVKNFRNAKYKKFLSLKEAREFMDDYKTTHGANLSHSDLKDPSTLVKINNQNTCKCGRSPP